MIKLVSGLTILVLAGLLIGGCTPANQPPLIGGYASPNQLPLITSLSASQGRVNPSGSCQVQCFASDPDGDELSYSWSANGGSISGGDVKITWTAPEALGDYTIEVKVTDGRGGKATGQQTIAVVINQPPIITSLTAEPQAVKKATTSTIECTAQDPDGDELSYTWSANGGSISGEGATVTWVAPNNTGSYIITITVTDGRGGQAIQDIDMEVNCGCGG